MSQYSLTAKTIDLNCDTFMVNGTAGVNTSSTSTTATWTGGGFGALPIPQNMSFSRNGPIGMITFTSRAGDGGQTGAGIISVPAGSIPVGFRPFNSIRVPVQIGNANMPGATSTTNVQWGMLIMNLDGSMQLGIGRYLDDTLVPFAAGTTLAGGNYICKSSYVYACGA